VSIDPHEINPDHWWTISNTAMSKAQALAAAQQIEERFPDVGALAVDPRRSLTLHMDRSTVELLREGLAELVAAGRDGSLMIEILDEWLEQAEPETDDDVE
jgi:hypothetical protein